MSMEEGTAGRSPSCRHCLSRPPSTSIHVRRPRLVGRKCQCSPPWDFRLPKYGERRPCTSGRCYFPFEMRGTDKRGVPPKHSGSAPCLCLCLRVHLASTPSTKLGSRWRLGLGLILASQSLSSCHCGVAKVGRLVAGLRTRWAGFRPYAGARANDQSI